MNAKVAESIIPEKSSILNPAASNATPVFSKFCLNVSDTNPSALKFSLKLLITLAEDLKFPVRRKLSFETDSRVCPKSNIVRFIPDLTNSSFSCLNSLSCWLAACRGFRMLSVSIAAAATAFAKAAAASVPSFAKVMDAVFPKPDDPAGEDSAAEILFARSLSLASLASGKAASRALKIFLLTNVPLLLRNRPIHYK